VQKYTQKSQDRFISGLGFLGLVWYNYINKNIFERRAFIMIYPKSDGNKESINNDIVFEIELRLRDSELK